MIALLPGARSATGECLSDVAPFTPFGWLAWCIAHRGAARSAGNVENARKASEAIGLLMGMHARREVAC